MTIHRGLAMSNLVQRKEERPEIGMCLLTYKEATIVCFFSLAGLFEVQYSTT